jgi:hypothetical protein
MRLPMLMIAMAVQTSSNITVEFLATIRILVVKYFNYRNELSGINNNEDTQLDPTMTDFSQFLRFQTTDRPH